MQKYAWTECSLARGRRSTSERIDAHLLLPSRGVAWLLVCDCMADVRIIILRWEGLILKKFRFVIGDVHNLQ